MGTLGNLWGKVVETLWLWEPLSGNLAAKLWEACGNIGATLWEPWGNVGAKLWEPWSKLVGTLETLGEPCGNLVGQSCGNLVEQSCGNLVEQNCGNPVGTLEQSCGNLGGTLWNKVVGTLGTLGTLQEPCITKKTQYPAPESSWNGILSNKI